MMDIWPLGSQAAAVGGSKSVTVVMKPMTSGNSKSQSSIEIKKLLLLQTKMREG
jgi:hypothetical protein